MRRVYVNPRLPDAGVAPLIAAGLEVDLCDDDLPPGRDEFLAGVAEADAVVCALAVNAGRGPLLDENALVAALRAGEIAAAGLDVFEREPVLAAGLAELVPHAGSAASAASAAMVRLACENAAAVLEGRPTLSPVQRP